MDKQNLRPSRFDAILLKLNSPNKFIFNFEYKSPNSIYYAELANYIKQQKLLIGQPMLYHKLNGRQSLLHKSI